MEEQIESDISEIKEIVTEIKTTTDNNNTHNETKAKNNKTDDEDPDCLNDNCIEELEKLGEKE